jgi:predicted nucleic acid-binding protein
VTLTLDANIWLAASDPREPYFDDAVRLFVTIARNRTDIVCPTLVVVETACSAARKARNADAGTAMEKVVLATPRLHLMVLDEALAGTAASLGGSLRLRGADAVYAAVAARAGSTLITLDRELRERAVSDLPCITPAEWLAGLMGV